MMSPQSYIPVVIRLTTLASSAYDNGSRSYLERCPSRRTEDDTQIDIGCSCHRLGEAIDMATARTVFYIHRYALPICPMILSCICYAGQPLMKQPMHHSYFCC